MIELLIGFVFGRATAGMNPLQVCIGILTALVMFAILGTTAYAVWAFAPDAADLITSVGILPDYLIDYLRIAPVADGDVLAFLVQLPKRLVICMLALIVIGFGLMLSMWMIGLVLKPVAKLFHIAVAKSRN